MKSESIKELSDRIKMDPRILAYLQEKHILSLATCADNQLWAANCFYVFDHKQRRFLLLTSAESRHAKLFRQNPNVAGTIHSDTEIVEQIQGIQFSGIITELNGSQADTALPLYYQRFPYAQKITSQLWQIEPTYLKFTDNSIKFAHKIIWQKT